MPGRSFSSGDYRYGFNGKEKDDEVKGSGDSYDFGARMYDPRLGRWLACDPLTIKYPYLSSYNFVANSPIIFIDPDGKKIAGVTYNSETGQFEYTKAALRRGTDKYINARIQTPEGAAMVMSLIDDKKTFKINVTDKILVDSRKNAQGKTVYSTADGLTIPGISMTLSSNFTGTADVINGGKPNDNIKVVTIDNNGDLKNITIRRSDFQKVYGNADTKAMVDYNKAQQDSGFSLTGREAHPQTAEEKLHNTAAHEETHLLQKENMSIYDSELPSFQNQKKASDSYQKWNDSKETPTKK